MQEVADQLLDAVQDAGEMDLIEQYAFPIPMAVISEMLGVPVADRNRFRDWVRLLFFNAGDENARMAARMAFIQYMHERIAERRAEPQEDILSGMVHASEEGDMLNAQELMSMIFLLLTAGYETTVHLIGTGIYTLLLGPAFTTVWGHPWHGWKAPWPFLLCSAACRTSSSPLNLATWFGIPLASMA